MPDKDKRFDDEATTFLLDVLVLNIDELDLEVEALRASGEGDGVWLTKKTRT